MRKTIFLIILLMVFSFFSAKEAKAACMPGHIDNGDGTCTATFYSVVSDGTAAGANANYTTAHNTGSPAWVHTTYDSEYVGQQYYVAGNAYYVYRNFLFFDTSSIPSTIAISVATLSLYGEADGSIQDFNITVQNGQPTYPHEPIQSGDYLYSYYSGNGGTFNTASYSITGYNNITLNATGRSWIQKGAGAKTKLTLRSDRDISSTAPVSGTPELVANYMSEKTGYKPKLAVTYLVPLLTVSKTGTGSGAITSNPSGINCGTDCSETYISGTSVILTAAPQSNSTFTGWSGDCSGTGTCTLSMTVAKTAIANFAVISLSPCATHNVSGYAWSENIGWISFSCEDTMIIGEGVDYGVNIEADGSFLGHAWSENIGWIDFSPIGSYPTLPNYSVKMDTDTGELSGWARALSYGGGWDGWIKTKGTNYGVSVDIGNGELSGWTWSDMVIGWVSFSGTNYGVTTSFSFNEEPEKITNAGMSINWAGGCSYIMALPSFNWVYGDNDDVPLGTDPQSVYQIRIDNDAVFGVDGNDNPVLDGNEFTCSGIVCSGGSSTSFSPSASNWISWSDYNQTYYWKVRVKDSNDAWSEWSDTASFQTPIHTYPKPGFIHTPESPSVGEEVSFIDLSTCYNSSNEPYFCKAVSNRYLWNFGDGESCDSNTDSSCRGDVTHSYAESLDHTVSLQITDDIGTCQTEGDTPINTLSPLPEYKEIPPVFFISKFLAGVLNYFKNLILFK